MTQIPAGWEETTLGEVAIINPTESIKKGEVAKNIPMDFLDNFTRKISKYIEKEFSWGMKFRNWDTLFARITPCLENGKTAYVDILDDWEIAFWSTEYIVIREKKERSNSMFLYYLSVSPFFRDIAIKAMTWTSWRQRVQTDVLVNTKLHLPPLPEQQAIAAVLSSFDDKIELLRAENQTLEQMGQELFKERFGKWKIGDELPEGWRVGKLGEEFDVSIGRTPPRAESEWFSNKPIGKKWISIKDMVNSWIYIFNTSEFLTDEAIAKFNIPIIPNNTTILSFKMTVGKLAITTEDMLSNEAIAHFKLKSNSVLSSEFIYCYLSNLDFNSLWSTSSIVTAINSTIIKELSCIIPDQETLSKFDLVIKPLFNKIKQNSEQIQTLSATRDQLLPKLMSWDVRVKI